MLLTVKFQDSSNLSSTPSSNSSGVSSTPSAAVAESIEAIASETPVLTLATADADGVPHVNMAFFALGPEFDLYFLSEQSSRHGRNVAVRGQASAAIWLRPPQFGEQLQGMQISGDCVLARDEVAEAAFEAYRGRFPSFGADPAVRESYLDGTAASSLYRFRGTSLTMVDEPRLGRRNYLNLDIVR